MTEHEAKAQMLDNIMAATSMLFVSKEQAVSIVGGEKHLQRLIESGKLKFEQSKGKGPSAKWKFPMSDVLKFSKQREISNWYQKMKARPIMVTLV